MGIFESETIELLLSSQIRIFLPVIPLFGHQVNDESDREQLLIPRWDADLAAPQEKQWRRQFPCGAGSFFPGSHP